MLRSMGDTYAISIAKKQQHYIRYRATLDARYHAYEKIIYTYEYTQKRGATEKKIGHDDHDQT